MTSTMLILETYNWMPKVCETEIFSVFQAYEAPLFTSLGFPNDETISWTISSCEMEGSQE